MRIGILGSGNVGGTLGTRWAAAGHEVVFGTRRPDSPAIAALLEKAGSNARAAGNKDAFAAGDVILLSTPWPATKDVLTTAGSDFTGKILIDATNPVLPDLSGLAIGATTSAAEMVAQWAPGARVVKAFNTVGSNIMANPRFGDHGAVLFYCGDNAAAKETVRQLVLELDFDARDAGPLSQARLLEPFALLWIKLALTQGYGREIAFQLMRR